MPDSDPGRTVPRQAAPDQTADHIPADDTGSRAADESSADPNRTVPRPASDTPGTGGPLLRTPSDVSRVEESAQAQAAEDVPGYVILGRLGMGGMGVVYKARHVKLNRVVALKMMLSERAGRGELIRFLAEAEAVAAIKHENVVQVFDYGESDGRPFMALEYLSGGKLTKLLPKGDDLSSSSAIRDRAQLLSRIARGVAAAHALGIIHRDLKPANVLLDEDGTPKVADFGLAKRGTGSDITQEQQGMGTPAYMAPEQGQNAKFVGPQADVWALGVIFYEMLTGHRPFTGTVQEILAKAQKAEPVAPRKAVGAIPSDLELICLKCLSKAPHERYPTAKELADDLDRFLRNEPISVRVTGPLERGYKWVKRNQVVSGAATAVFLALSVGLGFSISYEREATKQAEDAKQKKDVADAALVREAKEKQDAIDARTALEKANDKLTTVLARSQLGPLSAASRRIPLTSYEREALWVLAAARGTPLSYRFLEEATLTQLSCAQLENRAEYALQAVVGLDVEMRDRAERMIRDRAAAPETSAEHRAALALVSMRLEWRSPHTTAWAAGVQADVLGRPHPADVEKLREEAARLAVVAAEMEPDEAARVLLTAMASVNDSKRLFVIRPLAIGLAAAAERMEPAKAAEACEKAALILYEALRKSSLIQDVPELAAGLAAVARHMEPAKGARVLADALEHRNLPRVSGERNELAEALVTVTARMKPDEAVQFLTGTLDKTKRPVELRLLAAALVEAAARTDPAKARAAADQFAIALTAVVQSGGGYYELPQLIAATKYLEPERAASILLTAMEKSRHGSAVPLATGLAAVAARMEPAKAADACEKAAGIYLSAMKGQTFPREERGALARGVVAVTGWLEVDTATRLLIDMLRGSWDYSDNMPLQAIANAFAETAGRTHPDRVVAPLLTEIARTTPPSAYKTRLVSCLAAVGGRMEAAKGASLLLDALSNADRDSGLALARGLVHTARRMGPVEATDTLLRALAKTADPFARRLLAAELGQVPGATTDKAAACDDAALALLEAMNAISGQLANWYLLEVMANDLVAVMAGMTPAKVLATCDRAAVILLDTMEKAKVKNTPALLPLAKGLAAVAARMPPTAAAMACDRAARTILAGEPRSLTSGASEALVALSGRMTPSERDAACDRVALILLDAIDKRASTIQAIHGQALDLWRLTELMEKTNAHDMRARLAQRLLDMVGTPPRSSILEFGETLRIPVWGITATNKTLAARVVCRASAFSAPCNVIPSLPLLHPQFHPQPQPLPPQMLVELLKHPLCVGQERRVVLDALEFTYKRSFKDQWEFVEYARKHQPQLDLLTPPQRPR